MIKKVKPGLPFIIFLGLVLVAVFAFWQKPPFPSSKTTSSTAGKPSKPQGWLTYKNDQYQFSFSHPPQTQVVRHMLGNPMTIDGFLISGANLDQSIWIYKTNCSLECFQDEIINWWPKLRLGKSKEISFNGFEGFQLNLDGNPDNKGPVIRNVYLRSQSGTIVYFEVPFLNSVSQPLPETIQKILDSFTFY